MKKYLILSLLLLVYSINYAQQSSIEQLKKQTIQLLETRYEADKSTALQIWDYAEVGYKEDKSAALHIQHLKEAGFKVEVGIANMPTSFVATFGTGHPIIGILAEYDALPGISQAATANRNIVQTKQAGHACGHHLFGTASVAAGIAIKQLIEDKKFTGTIKVFGCPAEEGGSGKVYLSRDGYLNDLDIAIHWHPGSENGVTLTSALANKSAKFRFYGVSAHAAASPEKGRSALDAVEAMNNMANMLREHIPQETRIHYVITNGGKAPNVVPDFAEVYYYVRHPKRSEVVKIFDRIVKTAEGAALGTETTMKYEIIGGTHDLLLNKSLAKVMQKNLEDLGGIKYNDAELVFANSIKTTLYDTTIAVTDAAKIKPMKEETNSGGGSTDVGDVSYIVPTVGLRTATWVPGTAAHSWQAIAAGGTNIGTKGMLLASKTMALTIIDLMTNPTLIQEAQDEFKKAKGNYIYKPLLGDRKPALNYRD